MRTRQSPPLPHRRRAGGPARPRSPPPRRRDRTRPYDRVPGARSSRWSPWRAEYPQIMRSANSTPLSQVLPLAPLATALGASLDPQYFDTKDNSLVRKTFAKDYFAIAAHVWHRCMINRTIDADPKALAAYFDSKTPALGDAIAHLIGRPILADFGHLSVHARVGRHRKRIALACIAETCHGDLYLHDLCIQDPRRPIPKSQRRSSSQHFHGFGLLGPTIDRAALFAAERGCSAMRLTAAFYPLIGVFKRHGFEVESGWVAEQALELGATIPMERLLGAMPSR